MACAPTIDFFIFYFLFLIPSAHSSTREVTKQRRTRQEVKNYKHGHSPFRGHTLLLLRATPVQDFLMPGAAIWSTAFSIWTLKRSVVLHCQKVSSHTTAGNHKWDVRQASYMHKMWDVTTGKCYCRMKKGHRLLPTLLVILTFQE